LYAADLKAAWNAFCSREMTSFGVPFGANTARDCCTGASYPASTAVGVSGK
jgi:hypothetical protein